MAVHTALRRAPAQDRAKSTVERILDAAAAVLDEAGLPGFNTNAIAARANLTVPALYRYFRDKDAVLIALSERYAAAERDWTAGIERLGDPGTSFVDAVRALILAYARASDAHPAIAPLRAAMRAVPELSAVEERSLGHSSKRLAKALKARFPRLPGPRSRTAARLVIETVCSAIDRSRDLPAAQRRQRLEELASLVATYLSSLGRS